MKKHFYAHVIYDNPGVYDYEYIIDNSDFLKFSSEVLSILEQQYEEVRYREEMNYIDISGWEDFLELNKIECEDDDWFPYEAIWDSLKLDLMDSINGDGTKEEKYEALDEVLSEYLRLIRDADINDGQFILDIELFDDSRSFAKYFFSYLKNQKQIEHKLGILIERVDTINQLIEKYDFPNCDLHEGILQEWLNIYELLNKD